jgi:hypothetical protein
MMPFFNLTVLKLNFSIKVFKVQYISIISIIQLKKILGYLMSFGVLEKKINTIPVSRNHTYSNKSYILYRFSVLSIFAPDSATPIVLATAFLAFGTGYLINYLFKKPSQQTCTENRSTQTDPCLEEQNDIAIALIQKINDLEQENTLLAVQTKIFRNAFDALWAKINLAMTPDSTFGSVSKTLIELYGILRNVFHDLENEFRIFNANDEDASTDGEDLSSCYETWFTFSFFRSIFIFLLFLMGVIVFITILKKLLKKI